MNKTNEKKAVKQFLKEWIQHEEVQDHIKNEIEKELHKVLMKWATTGKLSFVQKHKHRTLAGFVNSGKANVCLDCGKSIKRKL